MMWRRLVLRDFVIVTTLDVELSDGFSVLTGETGAGKSILIDALQLVLGGRGDVGVVREGAQRCEISAEFDTPASLSDWLADAGFDATDSLLLRRTIDTQGKSRAWVNGSAATIAQLREIADHLIDIHGQHAWQSLTRPASVRDMLDAYASVDTQMLGSAWAEWRGAADALERAQTQQADLDRERERLAWQIGEVDKLAPGADEWAELNTEHTRLANVQTLLDAAREALDAISETDDSADTLTGRAIDRLRAAAEIDGELAAVVDVLHGAQAQLQDAAHTLSSFLNDTDTDPQRLGELDDRLSAWMGLARRYRRPPAELAALLAQWKSELNTLDEAADLDVQRARLALARSAYETEAARISAARRKAAPKLAHAVTLAMQQLGMAGGCFEVMLTAQEAPQSYGLEAAEFLVAGHAGGTPRPLAKVASGGELSRIALAIAVTTCQLPRGQASAGTLIFDEIDAGVGGAVADTVGRLMKQLGVDRQVLAVTHLPQVAACADHHHVVVKSADDGTVRSEVHRVTGEARVVEIARMLAGERLSGTSLAHAQEMLAMGLTTDADRPRTQQE
ncbi:MAG: DNA repair protein RecN [Burkholderiales bacterium PBB1]|nr:MAG: DNA repair protein RecN [Burkholderiales bacterium PBB1]